MAKKVRFPLDMGNDVQVRTIDELKENFSLEAVLGYYENGKLLTWLKDRHEDDLASSVEAITETENIPKKLCEIFDVDYEAQNVDYDSIREREEKLRKLKEFGADPKYLNVADKVAFDQDDLFDLLDEGEKTIYLCGEKFSIPLGSKGVTYIGINNPVAVISSKEPVDWEEKKISLEGVSFDEKYMGVISLNSTSVNDRGENTGKQDTQPEKDKYEDQGRELILEKFKEDGNETRALFYIDDEGEETRVSEKNGMVVLDYCESDEYIFYVRKEIKYEYDGSIDFRLSFTSPAQVVRYDKSSGESKVIIDNAHVWDYILGSKFRGSLYEDASDVLRSKKDNESIIFCTKKTLFLLAGSEIIFTNFDGDNRRSLSSDVNLIYWVHDNCVWYNGVDAFNSQIMCYSLKKRAEKKITQGLVYLVYTDGVSVWIILDVNREKNVPICIRSSMDGETVEEYAVIKGSIKGGPAGVQPVVSSEGKFVVLNANNEIEIKKGEEYTFS